MQQHADVAGRDPEHLTHALTRLLVQQAEHHDLSLEARHAQHAAIHAREVLREHDQVLTARTLDTFALVTQQLVRVTMTHPLATMILHVVPQNHRQQLERRKLISSNRTRLRQPQERNETILNRVERFVRVEPAPARVSKQTRAMRMHERREPTRESRRSPRALSAREWNQP